jgi:hypothetical protein
VKLGHFPIDSLLLFQLMEAIMYEGKLLDQISDIYYDENNWICISLQS